MPEDRSVNSALPVDGDAAPNESDGARTASAERAVVRLSGEGDSIAARIRRLLWEARVLAGEQVNSFCVDLETLAIRSMEIAEGGDAYPVGVRELASRLADDLREKATTLLTLQERNGPGPTPTHGPTRNT